MDPETIEKKIKELQENIESEIKTGQSKIKIMQRLQNETREGAQKIMNWKQKIEAFKEVLQ